MKAQMRTMLGLMVVVLMLLPLASAQYLTRTIVVAQVPFGFVAGGITLPGGQYNVRRIAPNILAVEAQNNANAVFVSTSNIRSGELQENGRLVFRRYGNRYFLAEVWVGGLSYGDVVQKSRAEKTLEREHQQSELASVLASKP
jgi:hypothetical protein